MDNSGCIECENGYYITSDHKCITNIRFIFNTYVKAIIFIVIFIAFGILLILNFIKINKYSVDERDSYITIDSDELNN